MNTTEVKEIIKRELPELIKVDPEIRDWILRVSSNIYVTHDKFDDRFDKILEQFKQDRIEQNKKWDEQNKKWDTLHEELKKDRIEQNKKWDEQNKKWDTLHEELKKDRIEQNKKWDALYEERKQERIEQDKKWEENQKEIKKLYKKIDSSIGSIGARWGKFSEAAFRNAMKGILEDEFQITVERFQELDKEGVVFGYPETIEIDLIIKNGFIYICEIKSSISAVEVYAFQKKVNWYESKKNVKATKKILISPMLEKRAMEVANNLGIIAYTHAFDVEEI